MIVVLLRAIKRAELAVNVADVRVVDVAIDDVGDDLAPLAIVTFFFRQIPPRIGERAELRQRPAIKLERLRRGDALPQRGSCPLTHPDVAARPSPECIGKPAKLEQESSRAVMPYASSASPTHVRIFLENAIDLPVAGARRPISSAAGSGHVGRSPRRSSHPSPRGRTGRGNATASRPALIADRESRRRAPLRR